MYNKTGVRANINKWEKEGGLKWGNGKLWTIFTMWGVNFGS